MGSIKGVGCISLQSVVDAFCSHAYGTLSLAKLPMTAVDVLHDRVRPFYEAQRVAVEHLLTANGWEVGGRPLQHPEELFLAVNQIAPRHTKVHAPYPTGVCERFHRTVSDESFTEEFRQKW